MIKNEEVKLDGILKTLFSTSHQVLINFINQMFDVDYSEDDVIVIPGKTEFPLEDFNYDFIKADLILNFSRKERKTVYHIEFQTKNDTSMAIRMFQYGFHIGKEDSILDNNTKVVYFPKQLVIFIEENSKIENELKLKIVFPSGEEVNYTVPVMKYWEYTDRDLIDKKLYILLPLQIFKFRKVFESIKKRKGSSDTDFEEILLKAKDLAYRLAKEISELNNEKEVLDNDFNSMLVAIQSLMAYLNQNYCKNENIEEEVSKMIKSFYDPAVEKRGIEKGLKEGRKDGLLQGLEKLLGIKFSDTSYMSTIKEIEDENTLNSVFEDAVKSNSIEEFKEKLKQKKLN
ncbi:hypothetical protein [Clostridium ljungdahlii]|uniref:Transposase (putative) YhgA-like domain-containing protein n=1 Tax=Clostridium ljungdahlii TaxID=1538 RepID=A0A162J5Z1_9CLOT|nr:hypothetical protein [Clostridium ljungdahlii]OAA90785.1 hypothetical protein WY13_01089 [Clostridium ljungdahlii]